MPLKLPFFQLHFTRGEFDRAEELAWTEILKLWNCGVQLTLMMWSFAAIFDFHTSENVSPSVNMRTELCSERDLCHL